MTSLQRSSKRKLHGKPGSSDFTAKHKLHQKTKGKANVAAIQNRLASKKSKLNKANLDVYDYGEDSSSRPKRIRSNITMDLTKDERMEWGAGDPNDDAVDMNEIERVRRQLQSGEDGVVLEENDEDIDSDEAFDQSDDEEFGAFEVKKTKKQSRRKRDDSDYDEDEEDENEEVEGMIDLSAMLDDKRASQSGDDSSEDEDTDVPNEDKQRHKFSLSEDDEDEEDIDDGIDSKALDALDELIVQLDERVDSLTGSKKRKVEEMEVTVEEKDDLSKPRKRRPITERTEGPAENEFASVQTGSSKLQLSDLLNPLVDQLPTSAVASLTDATKTLSSSKAAPVQAPLPLRTQDRIDRQGAYETTKMEVEKWAPTMRRIREAEHLSFPLQAPTMSKGSTAELVSNFKPTTVMESAVDKLLRLAKLRDEDIAKTEDLKMQDLTIEEITQRRTQLRQMRELMFRAEIKAKRMAKIKSKTYRKLQRKAKQKLADKLQEANGGIPGEMTAEERMKAEIERAKERATLKHKNTGKWAQSMRTRGDEMDDDRRQQVMEMYDRGEKLRRRIAGTGSGSEEDEGEEDDDEDEDMDDDAIKAKALSRLQALTEEEPLSTTSGGKKGKGVLEMKFMKDALAREAGESNALARSMEEELIRLGEDAEDDGGDLDHSTNPLVSVHRTGGRVVLQPASASASSRQIVSNMSETSTLKSSPVLTLRESPETPISAHAPILDHNNHHSNGNSSNPWLLNDENSSGPKLSRKKNEVVVGKSSDKATLSKNALKKQQRKAAEAQAAAKDDARLEIDVGKVMKAPNSTNTFNGVKHAALQVKAKKGDLVDAAAFNDDEEEDEERKEQEQALQNKKGKRNGVTVFQQRELVAMAFAGDNVVAEFEEAKRKELEEDAPKAIDTTLPGWGSWGGAGITKRPPKPERVKHFPGVPPTARRDANKPHVIISEKKEKKAEKYLVKDLPFPYTSKAQFERRMEVPLGMEWNTRKGFQKGTLPKVIKKMGAVIDPLEKLF